MALFFQWDVCQFGLNVILFVFATVTNCITTCLSALGLNTLIFLGDLSVSVPAGLSPRARCLDLWMVFTICYLTGLPLAVPQGKMPRR